MKTQLDRLTASIQLKETIVISDDENEMEKYKVAEERDMESGGVGDAGPSGDSGDIGEGKCKRKAREEPLVKSETAVRRSRRKMTARKSTGRPRGPPGPPAFSTSKPRGFGVDPDDEKSNLVPPSPSP